MDEGAPRGSGTRTILFTDLVGSTALRSRLGDLVADLLEREHDELLRGVVASHSGTVVKGTGDGIMAVFDSAAHGVACAVAIQQAVERRSRRGGESLEVRIGLSAGDVSWERADYFGIPVNQAARLEAAANGGQILASDVVRLLAGSRAEVSFRPLEPLNLKGLSESVSVCEVPWEPLPVGASLPLPPALDRREVVPFVGREAERRLLEEALAQTEAGTRQVVLLAGEPGIGKSRLAAEVAQRFHAAGASVLYGRCDEDLGVPFQPVVEALRHFVNHCPPGDLRARLGRYAGELVRLMPELSQRLPDLPAPLTASPETERYRLFDAVAAWLAASSVEEPLVLIFDDLHWAAAPSLLLLRHLARSSDSMRLLVLGTFRDTENDATAPLTELLADLRRDVDVTRVLLGGLRLEQVGIILETLAGHDLDARSRRLVRTIHAETDGNPFFVREVARDLAESGAIVQQDGRWRATTSSRLPIPQGVRDLVAQRAGRLSEMTRQTLTQAAVLGATFEPAVLTAVDGSRGEAVLDALEEATAAGLLQEDESSPGYRFSHALFRTALYDSISSARRVLLHRRAAESIEAVHSHRIDQHLAELAHHYGEGLQEATADKAVEYAVRAAEAAAVALAYEEVADQYQRALDALQYSGRGSPERVRMLLLALGDARSRAGQVPEARTCFLRAGHESRKHGDPVALARAALGFGRADFRFWSQTGEVDEPLIGLLREALERLPESESELRVQLLSCLAVQLVFAPDSLQERMAISDVAVSIGRSVDAPGILAYALANRHVALWGPDTLSERRRIGHETLELTKLAGSPELLAQVHHLSIVDCLESGDIVGMESHRRSYRDIADSLRLPIFQWVVLQSRTAMALLRGSFVEAEQLISKTLEVGLQAYEPETSTVYAAELFTLCREQDRLGELVPVLQAASESAPEIAVWRAGLARAEADAGNRDHARRLVDELMGDLDELPLDFLWSTTMALLAEAAAALAAHYPAERLYDRLLPYGDRFVVVGAAVATWGSVSHFLGCLAAVNERWEDAHRHFLVARKAHADAEAPPLICRTATEYGRMLLQTGQPEDRRMGLDALKTAHVAAEALGQLAVARSSEALLSEAV